MSPSDSHLHHYVPRWYQKRFLPEGQTYLCYLDLKPDAVVKHNFGYMKKALRFWEPARCFCDKDLYSLRFGNEATDVLEKRLFGLVDKRGAPATEFFDKYSDFDDGLHEAYPRLLVYLGAQRFRTPQGLDWLAKHMGLRDKNATLLAMQGLFQQYGTMWAEGIWEIVHAHQSSVKFIISDIPVTFFNRNIVPGGFPYPGIDDFPMVGTRTIFPLSADSCLLITHLQLVRNPWNRPTERRVNARIFQQTMTKLTDIQFGRQLEENEVLRINFILKRWARKYIAAANEDWLHPEKQLENVHWTALDNDWFLFPNPWKVRFTSGILMGYKDGSAWGMDEYGRTPRHLGYEDEERRAFEWRRREEGKREWAKRRFGKPLSCVIDQLHEDTVSNAIMNGYLEEEGLIPK